MPAGYTARAGHAGRPSSKQLLLCFLATAWLFMGLQTTSAVRLPPGSHGQVIVQPDVPAASIHEPGHSRPIICILTQPGDLAKEEESYLSAGYVKWLEAAGARVAPVLYDMPEHEIEEMFQMCNGVVFPGGNYGLGTDSKWFKAGEQLYKLAVKANQQGHVYPVLGVCLGLQLLTTIVTRDQYALVPVESANHPAHLEWTTDVGNSRWLKHVPNGVKLNLARMPIAMHNHHYGLVDESFDNYPELQQTFRVLAHTEDLHGISYVSMIEARDMPFMGIAFHPEKVPYEWTLHLDIPHTRAATDAAYHLGAAFVDLARLNHHRGKSVIEEDQRLIYNHQPLFMGRHRTADDDQPFEQVYIFKSSRHVTSGVASGSPRSS